MLFHPNRLSIFRIFPPNQSYLFALFFLLYIQIEKRFYTKIIVENLYKNLYYSTIQDVYQSLGFFPPNHIFSLNHSFFFTYRQKKILYKKKLIKKFILHKFIPKFILFHPICLSNFSIFSIVYVYSVPYVYFFWK